MFLVEEIAKHTENLKSPVKGGKWKPTLGNQEHKKTGQSYKNYKKKHGARPVPDMVLTGDMMASLTYEDFRDGVEVGFFDSVQAQKADNHNKFSGKSKNTGVPERNSIPRKNQEFKESINKKIASIVNDIVNEGKGKGGAEF